MEAFGEIDLKALARLSTPDRAFLSVYLSGPRAVAALERRLRHAEALLERRSDEAEQFTENVKLLKDYLRREPLESGALCVFACWVLDFFKAWPLNAPVKDMVVVDSSPYIRPLAELQDEYENYAVVVADNKLIRVYLVTSARADSEERIRGNVKNHVRKGGWSQQRYERRRDKQLRRHAKEAADVLTRLERGREFRRIIMVGSRETTAEIRRLLPQRVAEKVVGGKAIDLRRGAKWLEKEIFDLFVEEERRSEEELWRRVREEYLRGGLGAVGLEEVTEAAAQGRVEKMLVIRNMRADGVRCRDCGRLTLGAPTRCPDCGSESLFEVDAVEEAVEMVASGGGETDFVDPVPGLSEVGGIAALLRYRPVQ